MTATGFLKCIGVNQTCDGVTLVSHSRCPWRGIEGSSAQNAEGASADERSWAGLISSSVRDAPSHRRDGKEHGRSRIAGSTTSSIASGDFHVQAIYWTNQEGSRVGKVRIKRA
jgi:hypothetical protein